MTIPAFLGRTIWDNGTPNGSETYKFTGKPISQTTGLYYEYSRWYNPSVGRFVSQDPVQGDAFKPQSLNGYVYVVDRPTALVDPTGQDPCTWWNPFTYVGCVKNGVQVVNNHVVQPAENYVDNNVVQPVVKKVVVPIVTAVVLPVVNNVLIAYAMATVSFDQTVYNTLSNVGSQAWNGFRTFAQWNFQVKQEIDRIHITNPTKFALGVFLCASTGMLVAAVWEVLPEAAVAAAGAEAFSLVAIPASTEVAHGLIAVGTLALFLGAGCVSNIAGSVAD